MCFCVYIICLYIKFFKSLEGYMVTVNGYVKGMG